MGIVNKKYENTCMKVEILCGVKYMKTNVVHLGIL